MTDTLSRTAPSPRDAPERVQEIDAVRGFALLGILVINAQLVSGAYYFGHTDVSGVSTDWAVTGLVDVVAEMKFYLLFSFVFGYSVALQSRLPVPGGSSFPARYARRLLALFVLGACHALFLFSGDILTAYAVLGFALYFVRGLPPRTLVRIGAVTLVLFCAFLTAVGVFAIVSLPYTAADANAVTAAFADTSSLYRGSAADALHARAATLGAAAGGNLVFAPHIFAAMVFGLAAGKTRLLQRGTNGPDRLRRAGLYGLLIGVPGSVFMAACGNGPLGREWLYLGKAVGSVTAPALTTSYVCFLLLLWRTGRFEKIRVALSAAGRMSLTNYLAQSLVLTVVFTGYGLGLYGRVHVAVLLLGCAALYAAQVWVSARIMSRYGHGPVERLVHRVAAGRR
ncbi:DUF418 domain-containing protein [Streptomyces sp. NPDC087844]|uniref:DUF418 domain-containing protein n=1 Tax=Streptomyces sp. NPDC087844 TaxID=3365805 RepID=UPI0038186D95